MVVSDGLGLGREPTCVWDLIPFTWLDRVSRTIFTTTTAGSVSVTRSSEITPASAKFVLVGHVSA